jgi:hypothetical protein
MKFSKIYSDDMNFSKDGRQTRKKGKIGSTIDNAIEEDSENENDDIVS